MSFEKSEKMEFASQKPPLSDILSPKRIDEMPMNEKNAYPAEDVYSVLYDIAIRVLDKQMEAADSLDNKVRGVSAFTILVLGAPITFLSSQFTRLSVLSKVVFGVDCLALIVLISFSVIAMRITKQKYLSGGEPLKRIITDRPELKPADLRRELVELMADHHDDNQTVLRKKSAACATCSLAYLGRCIAYIFSIHLSLYMAHSGHT